MFKYSISFKNGEMGSMTLEANSMDSPSVRHSISVGSSFKKVFDKTVNFGLTPKEIVAFINSFPFCKSVILDEAPSSKEEVVDSNENDEETPSEEKEEKSPNTWANTFSYSWGKSESDSENNSSEEKVGD